MLHSLKGEYLDTTPEGVILDVGGVRFALETPGGTVSRMPKPGEEATLLTRMIFNANDGTFALYGFATLVEREVFDLLITMSGIGPKKAIGILSQVEISTFAGSLARGDVAAVSKLKGVGKKTAERMILELRDKVAGFVAAGGSAPRGATPKDSVPAARQNVREAIAALIALGCRDAVAEKAIASAIEVLGEDSPTEALLREGLKHR